MIDNSLPPSEETAPSYEPQLDAEDAALSSGNTRLGLLVGALLLGGVLTYALVPKQSSSSPNPTAAAAAAPAAAPEGASAPDTQAAPPAAADSAAPAGETPAAGDFAPADNAPAPGAPANPAPAKPGELAAAKQATAAPAPAASTAPAAAIRPVAPMSSIAPSAAEAAEAAVPAKVVAAEGVRPSTVTLAGRIVDEDGQPLVGATVLIKGSSKGTGTDSNGNYTIEAPAGDNTLVFGYGGYQDEEVRARGSQAVNVALTPTPGVKKRKK